MGNPHDPLFWAAKKRSVTEYTVKECQDLGDHDYRFSTTDDTGFVCTKAQVGAPLQSGDQFVLETVNFSRITGLSVAGEWRFHKTDEELAEESKRSTEAWEQQKTVELEANRKKYWQWEQELPDWLRARIDRFRDAAGEKFLRDGWGYELAISRLAVAYAADNKELVSKLDFEMGCSGNQHDFARALADAHNAGHDEDIRVSIAGLSPLTGSADYS